MNKDPEKQDNTKNSGFDSSSSRDDIIKTAREAVNITYECIDSADFTQIEEWGEWIRTIRNNEEYKNDNQMALEETRITINAMTAYGKAADFTRMEEWGKRIAGIRADQKFQDDDQIAYSEVHAAFNALSDYINNRRFDELEPWLDRLENIIESFKYNAEILSLCARCLILVFNSKPDDRLAGLMLHLINFNAMIQQEKSKYAYAKIFLRMILDSDPISEEIKIEANKINEKLYFFFNHIRHLASQDLPPEELIRQTWEKRHLSPDHGRGLWSALIVMEKYDWLKEALDDKDLSSDDIKYLKKEFEKRKT